METPSHNKDPLAYIDGMMDRLFNSIQTTGHEQLALSLEGEGQGDTNVRNTQIERDGIYTSKNIED